MSAAAFVPGPADRYGSSGTGEQYLPTRPTAPRLVTAVSQRRASATALPDAAHRLMPDRPEGEPS
jgi:hypothetical protein